MHAERIGGRGENVCGAQGEEREWGRQPHLRRLHLLVPRDAECCLAALLVKHRTEVAQIRELGHRHAADALVQRLAEVIGAPLELLALEDAHLHHHLEAGTCRLDHLFNVELHVGTRAQNIDRVGDSGVEGAGWCLRNQETGRDARGAQDGAWDGAYCTRVW